MAQPIPQTSSDSQLLNLKVPPHSIDAEQSVLGGLLIDNGAFDKVGDVVTDGDFYRDDHRRIFRHISRLIERGKPADVVTVDEAIKVSEDKDKTGGISHLAALAGNTPSAHNIRRYAEIVREKAQLRGLVALAQELIETCMVPNGVDPAEIAGRMEQALSNVINRQRGEASTLGNAVAAPLRHVDDLHSKGGGMAGLSTGFADLDRITGGFAGGEVVI